MTRERTCYVLELQIEIIISKQFGLMAYGTPIFNTYILMNPSFMCFFTKLESTCFILILRRNQFAALTYVGRSPSNECQVFQA